MPSKYRLRRIFSPLVIKIAKLFVKMKKALHGFKDYGGKCPFLEKEGCMLGSRIPFSCIRAECTGYENCTERLEVVE